MRPTAALLLAFVLAVPSRAADRPLLSISPVVECVGRLSDGTYFAWYGYNNRNDVAVSFAAGRGSTADGSYQNEFKGSADLGQPTTFFAGRHQRVFRIHIPGPHDTWLLKAPGTSTRTATASAGAASPSCAYDTPSADLSLSASLSDPVPTVGDVVVLRVVVSNAGTATPQDVEVSGGPWPSGVTVLGSEATHGTLSGTTWTLPGGLASGASDTVTVRLRVDEELAVEVPFEVTRSALRDPDSTPGNGAEDEDDRAVVAVTTRPTSGGDDGGLESDGRLATLLARREAARRVAHADAVRLGRTAPALVALARAPHARTAGAFDLRSLLPTGGPGRSIAYVTTPEDLVAVTNATAVLAADYLQPDGDRVGAVLALVTPGGQLYSHSKSICDRLKGARLESVRTVEVDGARYVLLHVRRPDGGADYAVSFVAYAEGDGLTVDSRYRADEYAVAGSGDVLTVQAWAATPDAAAALVRDVVRALGTQAPVSARNAGPTAPRLPPVFVRAAEYLGGTLQLDVVNTTGTAQSVRLDGLRSEVEEGGRASFGHAATVAPGVHRVEVATAPLFDADLDVVVGGTTVDAVYVADGAWTFASADARDALDFRVSPTTETPAEGAWTVERHPRLDGTRDQWAGLFRTLRPGGRPVDLTDYDRLTVEARGTGRIQILVETADDPARPLVAWADLSDDLRTFSYPFASLRRSGGTAGFAGAEVVALSAYSYREAGAPATVEIDLHSVRFERGAATADDADRPATAALTVGPNPSRDRARIRFAVPEAGPVRLDLFDVMGRHVASLVDGPLSAGEHERALPAATAPGTYVVRLRAGAETVTQTLTRLR